MKPFTKIEDVNLRVDDDMPMASFTSLAADFASADKADAAVCLEVIVCCAAQTFEEVLYIGVPKELGPIAVFFGCIVIRQREGKGFLGSFLFSHCTGEPFIGAGFDAVIAIPASDFLTSWQKVGAFTHEGFSLFCVYRCIH